MKKTTNIFPLLTLLLFFGCDQSATKNKEAQLQIEKESIDKAGKESKIERKEWSYDWGFKRENGSFLKYICEGGNMFLEYGNDKFKKILEDTFPCLDPCVGIPSLWWDNEDFICLKFGCGNPCWGTIVLPLNEKDSVQNYLYQYGYDDKSNVIVYLDYENKKNKPFLVARNLKTNETEEIAFNACGDISFMGYCIDSISYNHGDLYLRTRTEQELEKGVDSEGSKVLRRKIKL